MFSFLDGFSTSTITMFNGITRVDIPFELENRFVKLDGLSSEIAHLRKYEAKLEIIESHKVFRNPCHMCIAYSFGPQQPMETWRFQALQIWVNQPTKNEGNVGSQGCKYWAIAFNSPQPAKKKHGKLATLKLMFLLQEDKIVLIGG